MHIRKVRVGITARFMIVVMATSTPAGRMAARFRPAPTAIRPRGREARPRKSRSGPRTGGEPIPVALNTTPINGEMIRGLVTIGQRARRH